MTPDRSAKTPPRVPPCRGTGLATTALACVTLAVAFGMGRLFRGNDFMGAVLAAALAGHAGAWAWRRFRITAPLALALCGLITFLVALWVVAPASTWWGVPTLDSFHVLGIYLSRAHTDFSLLRAPVPATAGFVFLSCVAIGAIATVGDLVAFRLRRGITALLPSFALVVFTAALGTGGGGAWAAAGYCATALGYLLATHTERRLATVRWLGGLDGTGRMALLGRGAGLASAAVLAGVLVGPLLPGAHDPAALGWRDRGSIATGELTTISPLVDIQQTETGQSRTELFTVAAGAPAYWRLTALDHFDGNVWSSDETYRPTLGVISPARGKRQELVQRITIRNLSEAWLPAAYRPISAELPGAAVNAASSSLIATSGTSAGMTYEVTSAVPSESAPVLASVTAAQVRTGLDRSTLAQLTQLPAGLPESIISLANRIVRGESTPYGKALALQQYLRSPPFTYNLHVPRGHDTDALVNFLFQTKQGFCEQFAGAYAVMARGVGLPTRVAVGFTPGELRHGVFHVYGADAHAWPEVWLGADHGWVAFEPTPGRGPPGAESWTGVGAAQAHVPASTSATAPAAAAGSAASQLSRSGELLAKGLSSLANTGGASAPDHATSGSTNPIVPVLLAIAAIALLWCGGVPFARAVTRRRRRARATGRDRILVAWSEAEEMLRQARLPRRPSETFQEYTGRVSTGQLLLNGRSHLERLADAAGAAAYDLRGPDPELVVEAVEAAAAVERSLRPRVPAIRRWYWALDARPLLIGLRTERSCRPGTDQEGPRDREPAVTPRA